MTTNIKPEDLKLTTLKAGLRIDSCLLAQQMHQQHQTLFELVKDHRDDFEQLGLVRLHTGKSTVGRPERFALLNEDQCYLLLDCTCDTATARQLKVKLIRAFGEARRAAEQHQTEYLPTHHQLHGQLHTLATNCVNERFVHMNVNKLINQVVGLGAGQRAALPLPRQSLLVVAQSVAANAARGAPDHKEGSAHQVRHAGAVSRDHGSLARMSICNGN